MSNQDELARIESLRRLAREKQDQLAACGDPGRRITLLKERNELLAKLKRLRRPSPGKGEPRRER